MWRTIKDETLAGKEITMTNAYGLLPKADRCELDDELKARLGVWFDQAYPDNWSEGMACPLGPSENSKAE